MKKQFLLNAPWDLIRFITQLRLQPENLFINDHSIIMDSTFPCSLCNSQNQTWLDVITNCKTVKEKVRPPPNFPDIIVPDQFYTDILINPLEINIWYIYKIIQLIIKQKHLQVNQRTLLN